MAIYNLDTSIWLDFGMKRGKNGESALKLIIKIIKENSVIIYSNIHIKELRDFGYSMDEINSLFHVVKPNNLRYVNTSKEQKDEAKQLAYKKKIPKADALHAILARDNDAILISRDLHFKDIKYVIETKKPEEII